MHPTSITPSWPMPSPAMKSGLIGTMVRSGSCDKKRDRMARSLPEWETLRTLAAQIKAHTLAKLPEYLEEFERNATKLGAVVHWAADAEEHNEIVHRILAERGVKKVVKSKSMLTESVT